MSLSRWRAPSNKKGGIVMVLPFFGAFEYGESTEGVAAGPDERGWRAEKCWGRVNFCQIISDVMDEVGDVGMGVRIMEERENSITSRSSRS